MCEPCYSIDEHYEWEEIDTLEERVAYLKSLQCEECEKVIGLDNRYNHRYYKNTNYQHKRDCSKFSRDVYAKYSHLKHLK